MSTKSTITGIINSIDDGGLNTALEVRTVLNSLLDNLYGTVISETESALINTIATNAATLKYGIDYVKQGRLVTVNGFIKNMTGSTSAVNSYFTFAGSEFETLSSVDFVGYSNSDLRPIKMTLFEGELQALSAIANNETVKFSVTYFTTN